MTQVNLGDHIRIHFTLYGYLKMMTILEAVTLEEPVPPDLIAGAHKLLDMFRTLPISAEGPQ